MPIPSPFAAIRNGIVAVALLAAPAHASGWDMLAAGSNYGYSLTLAGITCSQCGEVPATGSLNWRRNCGPGRACSAPSTHPTTPPPPSRISVNINNSMAWF